MLIIYHLCCILYPYEKLYSKMNREFPFYHIEFSFFYLGCYIHFHEHFHMPYRYFELILLLNELLYLITFPFVHFEFYPVVKISLLLINIHLPFLLLKVASVLLIIHLTLHMILSFNKLMVCFVIKKVFFLKFCHLIFLSHAYITYFSLNESYTHLHNAFWS